MTANLKRTDETRSHHLRDVARLVASLDADTAETLLSRFSDEQARLVREAVYELAESPLDRASVSADFLEVLQGSVAGTESAYAAEVEPEPCVERGDSDENSDLLGVVAEDSAEIPLRSESPDVVHVAEASPRLHTNSSVDQIARHLRNEHPQTIAAVLTTLAPSRAAVLIQLLPPGQQYEVVRRIAEMEKGDSESMLEVEQQLREEIQREHEDDQRNHGGWNAVRSILDSADFHSRSKIIDNLVRFDANLMTRFSTATSLNESASEGASYARTAAEFDQLIELDHQVLSNLFELVPRPTATTALAGASQNCLRELISNLPVDVALDIKRRLSAIGPLRLGDIHAAQATMVEAAQGLIRANSDGGETGLLRLSA